MRERWVELGGIGTLIREARKNADEKNVMRTILSASSFFSPIASFALKVAHKGSVSLLCKTELTEANTMLAQGGISSVTNYILDNYEKHIEDTLIAGDGICDRRAA